MHRKGHLSAEIPISNANDVDYNEFVNQKIVMISDYYFRPNSSTFRLIL